MFYYESQFFFSANFEYHSKNSANANIIVGMIAAPGPYIATESITNKL